MMESLVRLIDPSTKQATAFYAALGITIWDIAHKGFHPLSTILLGAMAGLGVLGALGAIAKQLPPE